jgi:polyhydroxyalkanoate synthesis regulator phasin
MWQERSMLIEYLESREQKVVDITTTLFDDEQILKAYAKDIEDNTAKETAKKTARETAERMIKKGKMSLEEIADYVPSLSFEQLKMLETEILQIGK